MIFFKDNRRELFDLQADLSETRDVLADHSQTVDRLTSLMQSYIDRGRSARGAEQRNEVDLSLGTKVPKKKKSKKQ